MDRYKKNQRIYVSYVNKICLDIQYVFPITIFNHVFLKS